MVATSVFLVDKITPKCTVFLVDNVTWCASHGNPRCIRAIFLEDMVIPGVFLVGMTTTVCVINMSHDSVAHGVLLVDMVTTGVAVK